MYLRCIEFPTEPEKGTYFFLRLSGELLMAFDQAVGGEWKQKPLVLFTNFTTVKIKYTYIHICIHVHLGTFLDMPPGFVPYPHISESSLVPNPTLGPLEPSLPGGVGAGLLWEHLLHREVSGVGCEGWRR